MRKRFMRESLIELMKYKPEDVNVEAILSFIEDIMHYLEKKEDEEHETNQQCAGTQEFFRGCIALD